MILRDAILPSCQDSQFPPAKTEDILYKKDQETTRNYQLPGMESSGPVRALVQAVREVRGFRGSGKRRIKLHSARF